MTALTPAAVMPGDDTARSAQPPPPTAPSGGPHDPHRPATRNIPGSRTLFEYRFHIPHDLRAVGVARTSLRAALSAHHLPDLIDRAELLASEMLTNALVHTGGEADLRLKWALHTLRMTVCDTSPIPPDFRDVGEESEGGRGLHLLQILADRWNHFPLNGQFLGAACKVVWCEISRTPPRAW